MGKLNNKGGRAWMVLASMATAVGVVAITGPTGVASAAAAPLQSNPANAVTADALPTVQVDGVVWSQAIVGNTTTLNAKAWYAGTEEPAPWMTTATDSTPALQNPGAVGVYSYVSGSATNAPLATLVDNLTVGAA